MKSAMPPFLIDQCYTHKFSLSIIMRFLESLIIEKFRPLTTKGFSFEHPTIIVK